MWVCGLRGRGRAEQSWEEARLRDVSFAVVLFASLPSWGWSSLPLPFLGFAGKYNLQSKLRQRKEEGRKEGTPWLPKEARAAQEKASAG